MGLVAADLLPDYTASLNDAAAVFGTDTTAPTLTENLTRHLQIAARALSSDGKRPLVRIGTLAVVAGQGRYDDVPDDLVMPRTTTWNTGCDAFGEPLQQWNLPIGPLPGVFLGDGFLLLMPAPNAAQVRVFGSAFTFTYLAAHAVTDAAETSTLTDADKNLLLLRAQVEAMREMTMRNIHKPVSLRSAGAGAVPSNMQPAALYEKLLAEYKAAA